MNYKKRLSLCDRTKDTKIFRKMSLRIKPVQLMQTFYNDYNRIKINSTGDQVNQQAQDKSNHAQKMTKFLINYKNIQKLNLSIINNSSTKKNTNKYQTAPTFRTAYTSSQNKRGYFKNTYSDIHPFLITDHHIKEKQLNKQKYQNKFISKSIIDTMYKNFKLMKPEENKQSIEEIKQIISKNKYQKKQIISKIRYNFLINNAFKGQKILLDQNKCKKTAQNKALCFNTTKERIFPNQNNMIQESI